MKKPKSAVPIILDQNFKRIVTGVGILLTVFFLGNIFVGGWSWGPMDFIIIGAMLLITGLLIDFTVRKFTNPVHRFIIGFAILLGFLLLWAELAVDAVSQFLDLIIL